MSWKTEDFLSLQIGAILVDNDVIEPRIINEINTEITAAFDSVREQVELLKQHIQAYYEEDADTIEQKTTIFAYINIAFSAVTQKEKQE